MVDTADNQNPAAYCNADASAVVARLVRFIRDKRPQVVVTFDPTGGYGHPDHIAVHHHTLAAVHAAADATYAPDLGEAWQVARLFYPTFRREAFEELSDALKAQGITPPEWDSDDVEFTEQPVHAQVDVSSVVQPKWQAFKSHRTQFGPDHPFMRVTEDAIFRMIGTEWFELALPDDKPDEPYPDLYAGLGAPSLAQQRIEVSRNK
jgi:N-acetyl-1-D-myo-inositol-2-amino-2-deoxy-alpha-D-glucopyranoside deacetylase